MLGSRLLEFAGRAYRTPGFSHKWLSRPSPYSRPHSNPLIMSRGRSSQSRSRRSQMQAIYNHSILSSSSSDLFSGESPGFARTIPWALPPTPTLSRISLSFHLESLSLTSSGCSPVLRGWSLSVLQFLRSGQQNLFPCRGFFRTQTSREFFP